MKTNILLIIGASLICAALATAGGPDFIKQGSKRSITLPDPAVSLKEGPGMDTTRRYCGICHSLDYITTQQKFPKARWQAEVRKMIKIYGAPIPEKDAGIITDYIAAHYGLGG